MLLLMLTDFCLVVNVAAVDGNETVAKKGSKVYFCRPQEYVELYYIYLLYQSFANIHTV